MKSTHHKKHRLFTTLTDEHRYTAAEPAELYHRRWELELAIDELETHQFQQRVLVSQTPAGVVQKVAGLLMARWLLRKLMFDAAEQAGIAPLRISFTGTLKILRCRLGEAGRTPARPAATVVETAGIRSGVRRGAGAASPAPQPACPQKNHLRLPEKEAPATAARSPPCLISARHVL